MGSNNLTSGYLSKKKKNWSQDLKEWSAPPMPTERLFKIAKMCK